MYIYNISMLRRPSYMISSGEFAGLAQKGALAWWLKSHAERPTYSEARKLHQVPILEVCGAAEGGALWLVLLDNSLRFRVESHTVIGSGSGGAGR